MRKVYISVNKDTNIIEGIFSERISSDVVLVKVQDISDIHVGIDKYLENKIVSLYNEEEALLKANSFEEILELKEKLKETDYIAIKFAEGEMTAEEFAPYKEQRHAWRQRINELEKE